MIPERLPWHRPQWRRAERGIRDGRVPHALLLRGAAGNGKARFAARLAAALLCRSDKPPCGVCDSCRLSAAGSHPDRFDVTIPEDRREIVVDQIRDLVHSVGLTARLGGYKAVIVNPAEQMNRHAANTLLKTLEEPPGTTVFVLVSSNHALLLPTIRSRCQMIDFPVPDREVAVEWLRAQVLEGRAAGRETEQTQRRRPGQQKQGRRNTGDTPRTDDRADDRYPHRNGVSPRKAGASPDPVEALDLARGAPIRALELLRGGSLEVRRSLDRDLDELLAGSDPVTIAARWKEIGRATVSLWLTDILADRLRASALGRTACAGRESSASGQFVRLLPMLERCLEVRGEIQARSNANEQLALERLALAIAGERPVARR